MKMKKVKLGLPVMLQFDNEIEAFKAARPRIENLMAERGYDAEIGVFSFMRPWVLKENMKKGQIENQKKHQLPLYHVQLPIMNEFALTNQEESGKKLEEALDHALELIEVSPDSSQPDIDVHTGVFVYPHLTEDPELPGAYSVEGFQEKRDRLSYLAKERITNLQKKAYGVGSKILLENEPLVNFEPSKLADGKPVLMYKPFGTPRMLRVISNFQTFDCAHLAANRNVPKRFKQNDINPKQLFDLLDISGWDEYQRRFTKMYSLFNYLSLCTRALHVSNTGGIGAHLEDEELQNKWGKDGTASGILTPKEMKEVIDYGAENGLPIMIEANFDVPNIPEKEYREADEILNYALSGAE